MNEHIGGDGECNIDNDDKENRDGANNHNDDDDDDSSDDVDDYLAEHLLQPALTDNLNCDLI